MVVKVHIYIFYIKLLNSRSLINLLELKARDRIIIIMVLQMIIIMFLKLIMQYHESSLIIRLYKLRKTQI